jgi:PKD repeat protein
LKKANYLLAASLFVAATLNAGVVTHQLAQTVATSFYTQNIGAGTPSLNLMHTENDVNGNPDYYVFNVGSNQGFIIVSAEDAAHPILGYSNKGQFIMPTGNNNVAWWMNCRKQEIERARTNNISASATIADEWTRYINNTPSHKLKPNTVSPLLSSAWNQSPYYNDLCPGGSVTGCVATAMAQIMYYWQYPDHGHGQETYYDEQMFGFQQNFGKQSMDFDTCNFLWTMMPNYLSGPDFYVAELMYACGVSVCMDYSPSGSGAWVITGDEPVCAQNSYVKYFGYDPNTIQGLYEKNFTYNNWLNIIENELNNSRPVQYVGYDSTNNAGHTWVCDGYDASNNLHMNWGWGGYDNGNYPANALDVIDNFNWWNEAVIGIEPPASSPYFSGTPRFGCGPITVNYTDMSVSNVTITGYKWIFPGGSPGTSNATNPTITYNTPGTYDVTEIVTSTSGSDTLVMHNYISVNESGTLALSQGFESATFPPTGWVNYNPNNYVQTWQLNTTVGSYGTSKQCMMFNNGLAKGLFQSADDAWVPGKASIDVIGQVQRIYTPAYDFTGVTKPVMYFDVAYAPYDAVHSDSLAIYYSTDCGNTWTQVYFKGGMTLGTTGNMVSTGADTNSIGLFVPLNTNWRTDTIKIPAIAGSTSVIFAFENHSGNGSPIYMDNINIPGAPLGINNVSANEAVSVYPNPSNGVFTMQSSASGASIVEVYNVFGQMVYSKEFSASTSIQVDLSGKATGTYLYKLMDLSGKVLGQGKLLVQ